VSICQCLKLGAYKLTASRYNTKSNKVRVVKTPGGELRYLHIKKAGTAPKCGDCGIKLPGVSLLCCTCIKAEEDMKIGRWEWEWMRTMKEASVQRNQGACYRDFGSLNSTELLVGSTMALDFALWSFEDKLRLWFMVWANTSVFSDPSSSTSRILPNLPPQEDRSACLRRIKMCQLCPGSYRSGFLD